MPIPFFRCTKCNREFPTFAETEACENSHLEVVQAKAKKYTVGKFPYMLSVTFTSGDVKDYIADDMH